MNEKVIDFLNQNGYASRIRLECEFAERNNIGFIEELNRICTEPNSPLARIPDAESDVLVLSPDVYYSTQWIARQPREYTQESSGDKIGFDLYRRIVENGWNHCNGQVNSLDSNSLSNAKLDNVMKCNNGRYDWERFQYRYQWNRYQIDCYRIGLLLERQNLQTVDDMLNMYRQAPDYPPAQYRMAKLLKRRIGTDYQAHQTETAEMLESLNIAKMTYLPAAYFLGVLYTEQGRLVEASDFYRQASSVQMNPWGEDDEVYLCLAKMYHDGTGKPRNQLHYAQYLERARRLGNREAHNLNVGCVTENLETVRFK